MNIAIIPKDNVSMPYPSYQKVIRRSQNHQIENVTFRCRPPHPHPHPRPHPFHRHSHPLSRTSRNPHQHGILKWNVSLSMG